MADRQLEASFCNRKGWAREWYTGSLWQPEDALHQVVVFKLTLLVFVLGGLVVADATLTASLSKMFSSLTRHWAELCTLLKFKITESVEHCLWVGDTHTHTHTQVPVGSQLLPKYVWLPGNHGRFEGHWVSMKTTHLCWWAGPWVHSSDFLKSHHKGSHFSQLVTRGFHWGNYTALTCSPCLPWISLGMGLYVCETSGTLSLQFLNTMKF